METASLCGMITHKGQEYYFVVKVPAQHKNRLFVEAGLRSRVAAEFGRLAIEKLRLKDNSFLASILKPDSPNHSRFLAAVDKLSAEHQADLIIDLSNLTY